MSPAPRPPGVHLPSAQEETLALLHWAHVNGLGNVLLRSGREGVNYVVVLRARPHAHGMVLAVTRANGQADHIDGCPAGHHEFFDDLTLQGYRTAVCSGYLDARKAILAYLGS